MNVPKQINDLEVVQFGAPSTGGAAVGRFVLSEAGPSRTAMNVAICRPPDQSGYWTMFCSHDWTCIKAEFGETLLDAQLIADAKSDTDIEWCYPEITAASLFPTAQRYLAYSIITLIVAPFTIALPHVGIPIAIIVSITAAIVAVASTVAIWLLVAYVGIKTGGWLYGTFHFLLAVGLTPVALVGPFFIPHLLTSDFNRWREWEEEQRDQTATPAA